MTAESPTIREATPDDEPRLRAIQTAALPEPWPELLSTGIEGAPFVAVVETDAPVGYALVVPGDDAAYLAEIAVAPAEQGRGLGTSLLDWLLHRLDGRGVERVRLTVRADDERARSFYDGVDFHRVDRLPDHYDDGDGLLLERGVAASEAEGDGPEHDGSTDA